MTIRKYLFKYSVFIFLSNSFHPAMDVRFTGRLFRCRIAGVLDCTYKCHLGVRMLSKRCKNISMINFRRSSKADDIFFAWMLRIRCEEHPTSYLFWVISFSKLIFISIYKNTPTYPRILGTDFKFFLFHSYILF